MHQAGRLIPQRGGEAKSGLDLSSGWESLADRAKKWVAFEATEWLTARAKKEEDGQIVGTIGQSVAGADFVLGD